MKTIGIIGGLSPESTVKYYEWINQGVQNRLGGHNSARIVLASVNFAEFVALKQKGDWQTQGEILARHAVTLHGAGADFIVLATNTMHKVAHQIEAAIDIPFLHLADVTADDIVAHKLSKVGLLGTSYTMEHDFYKQRLIDKGLEVIVPDDAGRKGVNDIIYNELTRGIISPVSKVIYQDVIAGLAQQGAQGVILGCTEITMLINEKDVNIPIFDTTRIHVDKALDQILS